MKKMQENPDTVNVLRINPTKYRLKINRNIKTAIYGKE